MGVLLGAGMRRRGRAAEVPPAGAPALNAHILGVGAAFLVLPLLLGLGHVPYNEEIIFFGSLAVVVFLIRRLLADLDPARRSAILSIAIIIFVSRTMPGVGAGAGWWQMERLGFDEAFMGTLRQVSSVLAIGGMLALRGWMGRRPVPYLVAFLSLYSTVMTLPFLGMFCRLHEWTEAHFGFGARTIALIDTMADSPLGQVAMIPDAGLGLVLPVLAVGTLQPGVGGRRQNLSERFKSLKTFLTVRRPRRPLLQEE